MKSQESVANENSFASKSDFLLQRFSAHNFSERSRQSEEEVVAIITTLSYQGTRTYCNKLHY